VLFLLEFGVDFNGCYIYPPLFIIAASKEEDFFRAALIFPVGLSVFS